MDIFDAGVLAALRRRHRAQTAPSGLAVLTAAGRTGEEVAAELEVSAATLYNWRRTYGGIDTDAAKELKELREQNAGLKQLLAETELVKDALWEVAKGKILGPSRQALRRRHAQGHLGNVGTVGVQSCWAGPLHLPSPPSGADPRRS